MCAIGVLKRGFVKLTKAICETNVDKFVTYPLCLLIDSDRINFYLATIYVVGKKISRDSRILKLIISSYFLQSLLNLQQIKF